MEEKIMNDKEMFEHGMFAISKAAVERSLIFREIGIALEIGRDEMGDDLADKITNTLDNLAEMTEEGIPLVSNHTAMEYLAEMMTLINVQDEVMRKLTQLPDKALQEFIDGGNVIRTTIRILAKM
jgi:tRNA-dihydrouridine synthase